MEAHRKHVCIPELLRNAVKGSEIFSEAPETMPPMQPFAWTIKIGRPGLWELRFLQSFPPILPIVHVTFPRSYSSYRQEVNNLMTPTVPIFLIFYIITEEWFLQIAYPVLSCRMPSKCISCKKYKKFWQTERYITPHINSYTRLVSISKPLHFTSFNFPIQLSALGNNQMAKALSKGDEHSTSDHEIAADNLSMKSVQWAWKLDFVST